MKTKQLKRKWRKDGTKFILALIIIGAVTNPILSYVSTGLLLTVPCGIMEVNRSKVLWGARQLLIAGMSIYFTTSHFLF